MGFWQVPLSQSYVFGITDRKRVDGRPEYLQQIGCNLNAPVRLTCSLGLQSGR